MPKVVRDFYIVKNKLKEYKILDKVEYNMDQIYKAIVIKNQARKMIEVKKNIYICPVCRNIVQSYYRFCPYCSNKLKK